ncbi:MAG: MarR family transcriptional regulator [Mycobacterium sp.]|nr:MAG: MarR family transcriptional regulator [Mycobacterium sp.]
MKPDRPEPLAAKIAVALDRLARARRIDRQATAADRGLTVLQVELLSTLADGPPPPPTVGAVAIEVGVAQPTATTSLQALERKGLIERSEDPDDARRAVLGLTPSGREVVQEIASANLDIVRAIENLPTPVQEATLESLLRIIAHLVDAGTVSVTRTCLTCSFHREQGGGHHCTLLGVDLPTGDLRVNCPEHEAA